MKLKTVETENIGHKINGFVQMQVSHRKIYSFLLYRILQKE